MQSLRLLLCALMTVVACAPQELLAASGPGISPNVELNTAAETGNPSELKAALRAGASVNTPVVTHWGPNPELPLNAAVTFRHIEEVRILLKGGADPNTAIDSASCVAPDIIKELLEHGANPNNSHGTLSSPLTGAVLRGSTSLEKECLQSAAILIAHGAKINGIGNGDPPLSNAVEINAVPFIKLFLSNGAKVNILDGADLTPLMEALRNYANQIACSRELKRACPGPGSYLPTMEYEAPVRGTRKAHGPARAATRLSVRLVPVRSGADIDPQRHTQLRGGGHSFPDGCRHRLHGITAHLEHQLIMDLHDEACRGVFTSTP